MSKFFELFNGYGGSREGVIFSTVFSTLALMTIIVILPIIHVNFQQKLAGMLDNVEQCKLESRDIWREVNIALIDAKKMSNKRKKRDDNPYGPLSYAAKGGIASGGGAGGGAGACCACSQGAPGPRGKAGNDGQPGSDGQPGPNALPGKNGKYLPAPPIGTNSCQKCPPGPPGPPGLPGTKGERGPAGPSGHPGKVGEHNRPGPPGPPGPRGEPGQQGPKGTVGDRGKVLNGAPPGPSGPPGQIGPRGTPGGRGHDGKAGIGGGPGIRGMVGDRGASGNPGLPGPPGPPGEPGNPGSCNHCQNQQTSNEPKAINPYEAGGATLPDKPAAPAANPFKKPTPVSEPLPPPSYPIEADNIKNEKIGSAPVAGYQADSNSAPNTESYQPSSTLAPPESVQNEVKPAKINPNDGYGRNERRSVVPTEELTPGNNAGGEYLWIN